MATFPDDILRVAANMNQLAIGDFVNVFHYRSTNAGGVTDAATGADMAILMNEIYGNVSTFMPDGLNFVDVNVFNITQNRPYGSFPWPTLTVGGAATEELPAQVAAFVRGLTGFSRNWSRKFVGPFTEAVNFGGGIASPGLITALEGWADDWITANPAGMTGTWEAVVRYAAGGVWAPITSYVVTNIWATLRRRRIGRGS